MDVKIIVVFVLVLMVKVPVKVVAQGLDYKAWLGDEPLTIKTIVDDVVEYFSVRDPHGIPVLDVPEPIHIPGSLPASVITFYNPYISGHSQLRIEYVNVNLTSLSAKAMVSLPMFNFNGDYLWSQWVGTSEGFANITMFGIEFTTELFFTINDDGLLFVEPKLDLTYENMILNFTGLSTAHSFAVGTASYFFDSFIKPLIFDKVQPKVQSSVNERLKALENITIPDSFPLQKITFPDSISPVDFAVAMVRIQLRNDGFDPLKLDDMEYHLTWGVTAQMQNIMLVGLTTLHRTHEISAQLIDNVVYATVQLGTQKTEAGVDWSLSASILPAVGGHMSVEIDSLSVTIELQQPANIRSPPTLRKIDVTLGNFAVRSDGDGTFDYLVEVLANILPNCFRDQIMDKVEPLIHKRIQKFFNRLDVYRLLMDRLTKDQQDTVGTTA